MSAVRTAVPLRDVVPDVMPGDLELAVIPRPKIEIPTDRMIAVELPVVVSPIWEDLRAGREHISALLGIEEDAVLAGLDDIGSEGAILWIGCSPEEVGEGSGGIQIEEEYGRLANVANRGESYVLKVAEHEGRGVIAICAPTPQGAFYGIQTLKQLAYEKDDRLYVRETTIVDWPTFPARGSKRTRDDYEYMLKANFRFVNHEQTDVAQAHFADWWMAYMLPSVRDLSVHEKHNWVVDASPAGIQRLVDWVRESHEKGARSYCLHLDDQFIVMTEETKKRFKGDYFAALSHVLHETDKAIKQIDPDGTLYFLPTTYWTNAPYEDYAAKLRASGGLPEGCGMALCGPQVTSPAFPIEEIRRFSEAFGATERALVYSNHFRDNEFYPLENQPAELADVIIGIAPERGTATSRATRLDWAWNPEAYDPERSLMLAVREFSGLDTWSEVYELVRTLVSMPPDPPDLDPDTAAEVCLARLNLAGDLLEKLKRRPDCGLSGRLRLPEEQGTDGYAYHLVKQIDAAHTNLKDKRETIEKHTFRKARARRTEQAPQIDGILDEAAWDEAHAIGTMIVEGEAAPENQNAIVKCLYDDACLYFGCVMTTGAPLDFDMERVALGVPMPNGRAEQDGPDLRGAWALGGWNAIAIMLDPHLDRRTDYEFQVNPAGCHSDGWYSMTDPEAPGLFWNSGWRNAATAAEDGMSWTAEIAIPWKDLGVTPRQGHTMGLQVSHNTPGAGRMGSWAACPWGPLGVQDARRFGFLVLD